MSDRTDRTPPASNDKALIRIAEVAGRRTRKYGTTDMFRAAQLLRCMERCVLDAGAQPATLPPLALPVIALDAVGGPAR